jgi:hypothetical protein
MKDAGQTGPLKSYRVKDGHLVPEEESAVQDVLSKLQGKTAAEGTEKVGDPVGFFVTFPAEPGSLGLSLLMGLDPEGRQAPVFFTSRDKAQRFLNRKRFDQPPSVMSASLTDFFRILLESYETHTPWLAVDPNYDPASRNVSVTCVFIEGILHTAVANVRELTECPAEERTSANTSRQ